MTGFECPECHRVLASQRAADQCCAFDDDETGDVPFWRSTN